MVAAIPLSGITMTNDDYFGIARLSKIRETWQSLNEYLGTNYVYAPRTIFDKLLIFI